MLLPYKVLFSNKKTWGFISKRWVCPTRCAYQPCSCHFIIFCKL